MTISNLFTMAIGIEPTTGALVESSENWVIQGLNYSIEWPGPSYSSQCPSSSTFWDGSIRRDRQDFTVITANMGCLISIICVFKRPTAARACTSKYWNQVIQVCLLTIRTPFRQYDTRWWHHVWIWCHEYPYWHIKYYVIQSHND